MSRDPSPHEHKVADAYKILWVSLLGLTFGIVLLFSLAATFFWFKSYTESKTKKMAEESLIAKRKGPEQPLLEPNPFLKKRTHKEERKLLESYEWLDRENGIARIPIKQAIEILLYEH